MILLTKKGKKRKFIQNHVWSWFHGFFLRFSKKSLKILDF